MQSTPKFTGSYLICTYLKSQNHFKSIKVIHLKTHQVFQKVGGHIESYWQTPPPKHTHTHTHAHTHAHTHTHTPRETGLSLCGNMTVNETTTLLQSLLLTWGKWLSWFNWLPRTWKSINVTSNDSYWLLLYDN